MIARAIAFLTGLVSDLIVIVRSPAPGRGGVLAAYLKIAFTRAVLIPCFGARLRQQSVFGMPVHVVDYHTFRGLFTEVFVQQPYYFESRSERLRILDCGSNIGLSILFFKRLYPRAVITGFEPDPRTFKALAENVAGLADVTVVNAAVADTEGPAELYLDPADGGGAGASLIRRSITSGRAPATITVPTVRLSAYVDAEIDFMKLDVEGAEGRVIRDLFDTNRLRLIREIVLEYHHGFSGLGNELHEILAMLRACNYRIAVGGGPSHPLAMARGGDSNVLVHALRN